MRFHENVTEYPILVHPDVLKGLFMTSEVKDIAIRCLKEGTQKIVNMYTNTALLMNACDVAAKGYDGRTDNFQLSTTQNIPDFLKLPNPIEVEIVFHRDELPGAYRNQALQRLAEDFLIRMVSVLDDVFEDIYEKTLPLVFPALSEIDIAKKVRSSWEQEENGQVKLFNFLVNDAGLKSTSSYQSTVDMVFDRYYEMREIRHALIHNGGVLSDKNKNRLKDLAERLPIDIQGGSLANQNFLADGVVKLNGQIILFLRHWAYTTIIVYLQKSFHESIA